MRTRVDALSVAKFKVKIRSLTEEAKIIREFERKAKEDRDRGALREHRISVVRDEQRATLLAYAFIRGVPYHAVESGSSRPVDLKRVEQIAKSLAWHDWLSRRETIRDWVFADKKQDLELITKIAGISSGV